MPSPERVFLDWADPTALAAARWLQARPTPGAAILALVPTRQAGRRLRAALPANAAPRIITPADFLQPPATEFADPLDATLLLAAELSSPRARRCLSLFPVGVPARDFNERLALARRLRGLQSELAELGLSVGTAAARLAPGSAEAARWEDLARLLDGADATLARSGRPERESARLALAGDPPLPSGIREVIVIGMPDLSPLIAGALELLSATVTVLVAGPADPMAFDPWGRPRVEFWRDRDPGWSEFDDQVQFVSRPDALAVNVHAIDEVGLLDRELLPGLTTAFADTGRPLHDPTGRPLSAHWLFRTLAGFLALLDAPSFDRAVDLLRNGAVRAWLGTGIDLEAALTQADKLKSSHFPATIRAAWQWTPPDLRAVLERIEAALAELRNQPLTGARNLLQELGAAFRPELDAPSAEQLTAALETADAILVSLERSAEFQPRLTASEWLRTLLDAASTTSLYPTKPANAVEAAGWLELPWSEAPNLLLAGFNLGKVPAPLGAELFLTPAIRTALGTPGAEDRRARDAYLLARLLAQRPPGKGQLEVLVGQLDAAGSPLQPSPLLFDGAGADLPARVERLHADPRPPRPDPAWAPGWLVDPPVIPWTGPISVTDFERYLDCPFTFYLSRIVKMRSFEPAEDELDAAQFGDLLHDAVEHWAGDATASRSTDPAVIRRALEACVDDWVRENLGRSLSLPLRVQVETARSRLGAFAEWQARDYAEGWRIRQVEAKFDEILGRPWQFAGWTISGRVDRLDENERDGRWRVIDYKTYDRPDGPEKKHLRAFQTANRTWPPAYAQVTGSNQWWINLQLPLYRQLLIESGREPGLVTCGYLNLPKTVSETRLQTWDDLDGDLQTSALECARGVLGDLSLRRYWPPNPRAAHADFAELFPPDATRVIDPHGAFVRSCAP